MASLVRLALALVLLALPAAAPLAAQPAASSAPSSARGRVVADTLWSAALGTRKQFVVYLPPSYDREPARRYPVAYYLHGLWGNEWNWERSGGLSATMDSLVAAGGPEMLVVMPDGDDSWYTTWNALVTAADCQRDTVRQEPAASYCVPWPHYDDYVARDLVARVDSAYRTRPGRATRGIAGLSMGGYGAVTLALRYPDVYSAAASHSGVLAPLLVGASPFDAQSPPRYAADPDTIARRWGGRAGAGLLLAFGRDTAAWWARDPGRMAAALRRRDARLLPALMFDVGVDDSTRDQNRALHHTLDALGVPHRYAEWPGKHDWAYWRGHLGESLAWLGARIAGPGAAGR
ncbi:alpha/beta hydrolase family protein [Roseisolibacter sp. H3M3-2]|uniref:alpha/beta hydrolase n=1 Tax=Roseisolibacter sp. H3M3-2 TaxID=3031323 RepID=UPI0023DC8409|nr:alpha/beta hydrolase family protein [Roseisolibacter sp. H3M3-2]MDF1503609.1 alpha/beta hydrolase family protein [Roseisolibacter sp. H3M3-2]